MAHSLSASFRYQLGGSDGPTVRLGADVRRLAGFDPALVIDIGVPAGTEPVRLCGGLRVMVGGTWSDIMPGRAQSCVLDDGARVPVTVDYSTEFGSLSRTARTLYKLYFHLRPAETVQLSIPNVVYQDAVLVLPGFLLRTAERTQPVCIEALPDRTINPC